MGQVGMGTPTPTTVPVRAEAMDSLWHWAEVQSKLFAVCLYSMLKRDANERSPRRRTIQS